MESAKYFLTPVEGLFRIIYAEDLDPMLRHTLNLILSDNLFSITKEPSGGASIIYRFSNNEQLQDTVKGDLLFYTSPETYSCIQVNTANPALGESGMLSEVSTFFAHHKIPILCLSTWNCNYIYYPEQYQSALQEACLKDSDYYLEKN
jgi:hypothetical protein